MIKETDWKNVHILGRTVDREGDLNLVWTASGVEFDMNCSELGVVLEGTSCIYMPWISVILDGAWLAHIPVQEGENKYMLFKGMNPGVKHRVRIQKDFQADVDGGFALHLKEIVYEGKISRPSERKYKIEFIGDSITSGEGVLGAHDEWDWITPYFSSVMNYAVLTADALDADCRLISQSGWGIHNAWDNNPNNVVSRIYDSHEAQRDVKDYDHSSWKADAVVINLGTNDVFSFENPEYKDPVTGESFKNRKNPDGSCNADDVKKIQASIKDLLKHVREVNPEAYILWVYGMLGWGFADMIEAAVTGYKKENGDDNAAFLKLPDTVGEAFGSRGHPGPASHKASSEMITEYLRNVLK